MKERKDEKKRSRSIHKFRFNYPCCALVVAVAVAVLALSTTAGKLLPFLPSSLRCYQRTLDRGCNFRTNRLFLGRTSPENVPVTVYHSVSVFSIPDVQPARTRWNSNTSTLTGLFGKPNSLQFYSVALSLTAIEGSTGTCFCWEKRTLARWVPDFIIFLFTLISSLILHSYFIFVEASLVCSY